MTSRLFIETVSGNRHNAAIWVNKNSIAEYVVEMALTGHYCMVTLCLPEDHRLVIEDDRRREKLARTLHSIEFNPEEGE